MKKKVLAIMLCAATILAVGCSSSQQSQSTTEQTQTQEEQDNTQTQDETQGEQPDTQTEGNADDQQADTSEAADTTTDTGTESGNTLIAYFTWADNTEVADPDSVDVDATTSASVLQPGNVGRIASWIQEEIGGDLFSIQVTDKYSSDYDECLDRAADENAQNARPELATHVENMDQYDTIYLGYPNWWYSCPMAILSFIDEYNLEGKQIVLFCSHGTGGLARSVEAITEELPDNCSISQNVLGVYRPDVAQSQPQVVSWVQEIESEIRS